MSIIINIIISILSILMIFISYYFYIKSKAQEAASAAINKVEQDDSLITTSYDKLKEAAKQVYALIPASAKLFISEKVVEFIVQQAFDNIEEYAKKQVIKKNNK